MSDFKILKATNVILDGKIEIDIKSENEEKMLLEVENREDVQNENEFFPVDEKSEIEITPENLFASAEIQYQEILRKANEEADAIIKESYNESSLIFEKTKEEAYRIGFKEGETRGYEEVENYINEAIVIKQKMQDEKKEMAHNLKSELIQLVLETIEKVLMHELNEDNELLLKLVEKGIKHCTFTQALTIRVSEHDLDYVSSSKNKVFLMTEGVEKLDIKVDKSLPQGSVVIETPAGTVDSSMTTQIEIIRKTFNELLRSE
ncbi:MAG: hypothetical protein LR001_03055 [Clostridiales bacterium]|nr:hypothetical protein [Clostridiales bacterium]